MIVFGYKYNERLAKAIAQRNRVRYATIEVSRFPDREKLIKIPVKVKGEKCVIINSLHDPDEKIIDVIFTAQTLKDMKAKSVTLVAPYLGYMRQDKRFHKGEAISARIIAKLFHPFFNKIITVDPHLHRIKSMGLLFRMKTRRLTANGCIAEYIKKHFKGVFIVGPDEESCQWVKKIAKECNADMAVMKKHRYTSRKVKLMAGRAEDIKKHLADIAGKRIKKVIIVDDIISTGRTMIAAVKYFKRKGAKNIICIAVHGLFVEGAYEKLKKAGAKRIITTNTIPHFSNRINIADVIEL